MDSVESAPVSPCAHCFPTVQVRDELNLSIDWHSVEVVNRHLRTLDRRHPLDGALYVQRVVRPYLRVANCRNTASSHSADGLTAESLPASILSTHRSLLQGSTQWLYLRIRMHSNFVCAPVSA